MNRREHVNSQAEKMSKVAGPGKIRLAIPAVISLVLMRFLFEPRCHVLRKKENMMQNQL